MHIQLNNIAYLGLHYTYVYTETERPELKDLCKYVLPQYAAQWKMIGIFLGMQPGQLDVIKEDNPTNANGCCIDLFTKWLQGSKDATTWEKMFEAIDSVTNLLSCDNTGITNTTTTSTGK